jgi:hypothetical protein
MRRNAPIEWCVKANLDLLKPSKPGASHFFACHCERNVRRSPLAFPQGRRSRRVVERGNPINSLILKIVGLLSRFRDTLRV